MFIDTYVNYQEKVTISIVLLAGAIGTSFLDYVSGNRFKRILYRVHSCFVVTNVKFILKHILFIVLR